MVETTQAHTNHQNHRQIQFLRQIGADAVGMSTAPEVLVAYHAGMRVLGFSSITNQSLDRTDAGEEISHEAVLRLGQQIVPRLAAIATSKASASLIKLSQAGYETTISPPTLIQGRGIKISTLDFSRIVVPLTTDIGEIMVHLALRESPPGMRETNFVAVSVEQV